MTLQELQDLPAYVEECSIRKMPEIGFLLCLPFRKLSDKKTEDDYKILNLEFKVFIYFFIYLFNVDNGPH